MAEYYTEKTVHYEDQNGKWSITAAENDFLIAVETDDISRVKEILTGAPDEGFEIDARDKMRKNALIIACERGFPHLVRMVMEFDKDHSKDLDVNAQDAWGTTALMHALSHDDELLFGKLLRQIFDFPEDDEDLYTVDPDTQNEQGWSVFHFLASTTPVELVVSRFKLLVEEFEKQMERRPDDCEEIDLNIQTNMGETFLMQSLCNGGNGNSDLFEYVVNEEKYREEIDLTLAIDLKTTKGAEEDGSTILTLACQHGKIDAVNMLLALPNVANFLNLQNKKGQTALIKSCAQGSEICVKALLDACFNTENEVSWEQKQKFLNLKDTMGNNALITAAAFGYQNLVELLIDAANKLEVEVSALKEKNDESVAKVTLPVINVNQKNREGLSAIFVAVKANRVEVVAELLKSTTIDIKQKNPKSQNARQVAATQQFDEITDMIKKWKPPAK